MAEDADGEIQLRASLLQARKQHDRCFREARLFAFDETGFSDTLVIFMNSFERGVRDRRSSVLSAPAGAAFMHALTIA